MDVQLRLLETINTKLFPVLKELNIKIGLVKYDIYSATIQGKLDKKQQGGMLKHRKTPYKPPITDVNWNRKYVSPMSPPRGSLDERDIEHKESELDLRKEELELLRKQIAQKEKYNSDSIKI